MRTVSAVTLHVVFICAAVFLPISANASKQDEAHNPVSRFTRSLAQLDRVSEMCKEIETARYETYSLLIRHYINALYEGVDPPYWVLSNVRSRISDQEVCKWLVSESLIHYQHAYRDYVELTKPAIMPPLLTESMSEFGSAPVDITTLGVARPTKR